MNINLTPEFESFLTEEMQSGRYSSASEVVMEALRLLRQNQAEHEAEPHPLKARVDSALTSLTRGEGERGEAYIETPTGKLEESQEDERPSPR